MILIVLYIRGTVRYRIRNDEDIQERLRYYNRDINRWNRSILRLDRTTAHQF